ncbi:PD40 domain-containing protein [Shewanella intestini]|uniref:WD40 repeat protein n=1 Tax=Shewanella intestini TaxID=2017544 RepID=A0ABS5I395_9GAMM|nr:MULTISPECIES: PD40 domain-containing protein [Shewanella]MBR9728494.1 hypothetical protein [Shewanella intestini]MRG36313.1 hypothetical protein [Shewanella sp. XMDDZSB0408]
MIKSIITMTVLTLTPLSAHAQQKPYYNEAAANHIVEFAPGIISTRAHFEINTVFNNQGDTVYFARCQDDFSQCTLMQSQFVKGQWQAPSALAISGQYLDADPYLTADHSQMYFVSKRPLKTGQPPTKEVNLWRSNWLHGQWQAPEYLAELSSPAADLYPSLTDNGDLYFPSFRNNDRTMYVAKASESGFDTPQALPAYIYGKDAKIGDSAVSRDGKQIIFSISGRADSLGKGDLYVSTLVNNKWTVAKSLGKKVNSNDHEFTPILSPDGQYLFFTRIENGKGNLYQIKLSSLSLN